MRKTDELNYKSKRRKISLKDTDDEQSNFDAKIKNLDKGKTRIEEHIKKDNMSRIFKHLHSTGTCVDRYNSLSFKMIDKANSIFDSKIKETLHINWRKPNLNVQQNHLALTFLLQLLPPCSFLSLFFVFFRVFFFFFRICRYCTTLHLNSR